MMWDERSFRKGRMGLARLNVNHNHMWCDVLKIAPTRWRITFTKTIYDRSPGMSAAEVKYYEDGGVGRRVDTNGRASAEENGGTN